MCTSSLGAWERLPRSLEGISKGLLDSSMFEYARTTRARQDRSMCSSMEPRACSCATLKSSALPTTLIKTMSLRIACWHIVKSKIARSWQNPSSPPRLFCSVRAYRASTNTPLHSAIAGRCRTSCGLRMVNSTSHPFTLCM